MSGAFDKHDIVAEDIMALNGARANGARQRNLLLASVLLLALGQASAHGASASDREGGFSVLRLPPGVTEVLLSEDGRFAAVEVVGFDRERGIPERLVLLVDLNMRRVQSRIALPAVSCCEFPVFSMTGDGRVVAVGGADRVDLFDRQGTRLMGAGLPDPTLNTVLKFSHDGRMIVAGQSSGRITAYGRGASTPLWSVLIRGDLLDLAVSGDGRTVAAVMPHRVVVLSGTSGSIIWKMSFAPTGIVAMASARRGSPLGLAWKEDPWSADREKRELRVALVADGKWLWKRTLQEGEFPVLEMDALGKWLAVGDALGTQGALISATGEIVWQSGGQRAGRGAQRTAVNVASDGRAAIARGSQLEIRDADGRRVIWRGTLPGIAHSLRLEGLTLAVLGSKDAEGGLPDRLWFSPLRPN